MTQQHTEPEPALFLEVRRQDRTVCARFQVPPDSWRVDFVYDDPAAPVPTDPD